MKDKNATFVKLNKVFDLLIDIFGILSIAILCSLISTKISAIIIIQIIITLFVFGSFFILNIERDKPIIYALHPKNYNSNIIKGLLWFWFVFMLFGIIKINQNSLFCAKCLLISVIFSVLLCFIDFFFYCKIEH